MSRSLVGSSSSRTFGSPISRRMSCRRRRSPPERSLTSVRCFSPREAEALQQPPGGELAARRRGGRSRAPPRPPRARAGGRGSRPCPGERRASLTVAPRVDGAAWSASSSPARILVRRRLAGAVDADQREAVARAELPGDVVEDRLRAVGEADVLGVDHLRAQAASWRTSAARSCRAARARRRSARWRPRSGTSACSCGPAGRAAARRAPCGGAAGGALLSPRPGARARRGRACRPRSRPRTGGRAVGDLPRVGADGVEEPAIVGDDQHRAAAGREVVREPVDALDVEVVGRLVEQQQLGVAEQGLGEVDPSSLAAGERCDRACPGRAGSGASRRRRAGPRARCGSAASAAHSWSARPPTSSSRTVLSSSRSSPWPSRLSWSVPTRVTAPASGSSTPAISLQQRRLPVAVAADDPDPVARRRRRA